MSRDYTVYLANIPGGGPDNQPLKITADDVEQATDGANDSTAYFNFTKDDGAITVAAIPCRHVLAIKS